MHWMPDAAPSSLADPVSDAESVVATARELQSALRTALEEAATLRAHSVRCWVRVQEARGPVPGVRRADS